MKNSLIRTLKSVSVTLMVLAMSGCGGCDDGIKLIRTCSKNVGKACHGSPNDFYLTDNPNNKGICTAGVIECPMWTKDEATGRYHTAETYCDGDEECISNWENIKTEDVCVGYVGWQTEVCDGLDNNCDGQVDEPFDSDGDGFMAHDVKKPSGMACGYDCDDNDPNVHPDAEEVCDGVDNNCNCRIRTQVARDTNNDGVECGCTSAGCDANVDERPNGLPITTMGICEPEIPENINLDNILFEGTPCSYEIGKVVCRNGAPVCEGAEFVGPQTEWCDGVDNNCDGEVDYILGGTSIEGVGHDCGTNVGICEYGTTVCQEQDIQCEGGVGPIILFEDECDGLDTDCDGEVDEDAEPILCHNGCPQFGYMTCEAGEYGVCTAPTPGDEDADPCNGLDDDCDGEVDEGQECECEPEEVGPNAPDCTPDEMVAAGLTCGVGKKDCECQNGECQYGECYLACDPLINGASQNPNGTWWGDCPDEQCDGWDHDCDGEAPNEHINGMVEVPCLCDPNSPVPAIAQQAQNGNGACEQGICTLGTQTCEFDPQTQQWGMAPLDCNAVGPEEEICDELDNDCDGLTDEELNSFDRVDMVFAIDVTGSMDTVIQDVHTAISAYAMDFEQTEHRFALVLFPAPFSSDWENSGTPALACGDGAGDVAYWNVTNGLVPVGQFLAALNLVITNGTCCAHEPSYDVLMDLTSVQDPAQIGWREDAYPYVFLMGDENAQTWTGLTEAQVGQQAETCDGIGGCPCVPGGQPDCQQPVNEFEVHCFTSSLQSTIAQYDEICYNDVHGDNVYNIDSITAEMLRAIFADVCLPSNDP